MERTDTHGGHRTRLRQRVREAGLDGLAPHEVIEYLLCHAVPRQDVNELAHRLIERFGSVGEVLRGEAPQLEEVPGVGRGVARWLMLVGEAVEACAALQPEDQLPLKCLLDTMRYGGDVSARITPPASLQLCMDMEGMLIFSRELCPSRAWGEPEILREALGDVLSTGARSAVLLILVGKLPAEPDAYDLERAAAYAETLHLAGSNLLDVVFAGYDGICSLRQRDLIPQHSPGEIDRAIRENYLLNMPDLTGLSIQDFQTNDEGELS